MLKLNIFFKKFIVYIIVAFILINFANYIAGAPDISINFDNLPIFFLFFVAIFIYSIRSDLAKTETIKWKRWESLFFIGIFFAFQLIAIFLLNAFFKPTAERYTFTVVFYLFNIINLISAIIMFPAVFNLDFSVKFYRRYENRILLNVVVFMIGATLAFFLQSQWTLFSNSISVMTTAMLPSSSYIIDKTWQTPIITYKGFTGNIGAPCSGVDSISLFLFVFTALVINNYKKFSLWKTILFIVLGSIGILFVNALRLVILFWIGGTFSRDIAMILFHEDIGWIFYLVYILVMLIVFLKTCIKKA